MNGPDSGRPTHGPTMEHNAQPALVPYPTSNVSLERVRAAYLDWWRYGRNERRRQRRRRTCHKLHADVGLSRSWNLNDVPGGNCSQMDSCMGGLRV